MAQTVPFTNLIHFSVVLQCTIVCNALSLHFGIRVVIQAMIRCLLIARLCISRSPDCTIRFISAISPWQHSSKLCKNVSNTMMFVGE